MMRSTDLAIVKDTARRLLHNKAERRKTGLYPLEMLILYVTMRCNAKCDHCFCWEDLNIGIPEMSLERLEKLADSVPAFRQLLLTGGEPTMRKDLVAVVRAFASRHKVETVLINTNGLKPALITQIATEVKTEFPDLGLDFQISLDGLQETHDRVRGVPGNFQKALETLRIVRELGKNFQHLHAHVLTVIMELNFRELVPLNDYLREHIGPDLVHGFELVRDVKETAWGIPPEVAEKGVGPKKMNLPPRDSFPQIAEDLKSIQSRAPYRASAFHIHNLAQLKMVETAREQYKCVTAGQAVGVVYTNGDVAHCEFTLPFANLSEFDDNFDALWHSGKANERRAQISKCYCIHGCFHGKAVEYSWKGIAEMAKSAG
ncbi:radical SAM protein [Candidatus Sumerlaeota bacterium]|nr:radical SAM protein [Candidatus Sumerlaeota bacterium]